ncbi:tyrosine-type recombinase/integrase [Vibrio rotiferianus]|uniref:tyrosine-type recombinase/integrase n=1 Tax=Vibrio rotiferianus TaxID=190895 RepID=UPI003980E3F0
MPNFNQRVQIYLESKKHTQAPKTFRSNRARANNLMTAFGQFNVESIKEERIQRWIDKQHPVWSNKTLNEHFTILRVIFASAEANGLIMKNPMANIHNFKTTTKEPNPFTLSDIKAILNHKKLCRIARLLIGLGVMTGLRISELLGLSWCCVNFEQMKLSVKWAKSSDGYRVPKTEGSVRCVDLNEHALAMLRELHDLTGNKRSFKVQVLLADNKSFRAETVKPVFINSKTNRAFIDDKQFAKTFLTPALAELSIEHRGPGQVRHTFASQALTAGINENYIAKQMGHRDTEVIRKHYARWIDADADDNADRLGKAFNRAFDVNETSTNQIVETTDASQIYNNVDVIETLRMVMALQKQPNMLTAISALLGNGGQP